MGGLCRILQHPQRLPRVRYFRLYQLPSRKRRRRGRRHFYPTILLAATENGRITSRPQTMISKAPPTQAPLSIGTKDMFETEENSNSKTYLSIATLSRFNRTGRITTRPMRKAPDVGTASLMSPRRLNHLSPKWKRLPSLNPRRPQQPAPYPSTNSITRNGRNRHRRLRC